MNEKFYALAPKKQQCILNAAMEVFSQNDYRHAVTDEIAVKAGISKGLLFHYFHNKKELYLYLFHYSEQLLARMMEQTDFQHMGDFFEIMNAGAKMKMEMMEENPYIMDFVLRAYFSQNEEVSKSLQKTIQERFGSLFKTYFSSIDFSRFRKDVDPAYLFQMLIWMMEGYLNEKRRSGGPLSADEMMADYQKWAALFREFAYRPNA